MGGCFTEPMPAQSTWALHGRHLLPLMLQVRLAQLDKEGAELREENAGLHAALARADALSAADWKAKAETASAAAAAAEKEAAELLRDKVRYNDSQTASHQPAQISTMSTCKALRLQPLP